MKICLMTTKLRFIILRINLFCIFISGLEYLLKHKYLSNTHNFTMVIYNILTGILKCSVTPRPFLPSIPNDMVSSMNILILYFIRMSINFGKLQIFPVFE